MLLRLPRCRFAKVYQHLKSLQQHKHLVAAHMVYTELQQLLVAFCAENIKVMMTIQLNPLTV